MKLQIKFYNCHVYPKLTCIIFKRLDGDIISYKNICLTILKKLQIHEQPILDPLLYRDEDANTIHTVHDDHEKLNSNFTERTISERDK